MNGRRSRALRRLAERTAEKRAGAKGPAQGYTVKANARRVFAPSYIPGQPGRSVQPPGTYRHAAGSARSIYRRFKRIMKQG